MRLSQRIALAVLATAPCCKAFVPVAVRTTGPSAGGCGVVSAGRATPASTTASCSPCRAVPAAGTHVRREGNRRVVLRQTMSDAEMEEDQALIARVAAEVMEQDGVGLDQLINPSKVINLERELAKLQKEMEVVGADSSVLSAEMDKIQAKLSVEKRAVMRDWLKTIFVGQSVLATFIAGLMVYDKVPGFEHVDLVVRVLGFWCIWLFVVPSLRARKPSNPAEKTALNAAFIATPLTNLLAPFVTKDPVSIYWANIAVVGACYAWGFASGGQEGDDDNQPEWLKFAMKALDFGSGKERGARK